jgi:UDP-glucose 4-epimerase
MRVCVTGGAGFIGSHLVEYHLGKGDSVHVIDDLSTGRIENVELFQNNSQYTFDKADILTWDGLSESIAQADRIYHMAAVVGVYRVIAEPINVLASNIPGCERVLRAALASKKNPCILIASSSEVYGNGLSNRFNEDDDVIIETSAQNRWNYPISKLADEAFGLSYASHKGLPITVVRFFNTIGPRQSGRYGMVVPNFIEEALSGNPIKVFGTGEQTRSFCDVRDTVIALDLLLNNPKSIGQIVNVGNDREISINGLADLVKEKSNSNHEKEHISYEEAYGQPYVDIMRRRPDLTKFLSLTNYAFKWTLEETIINLIENARK